jgi:hypothetical protein
MLAEMGLRNAVLATVMCLGCGPAVALPDASGGAEDDDGDTTGVPSGTSTTSTTGAPLPTGSGPPTTTATDDTVGESSSSSGYSDFIVPPDGYGDTIECDIWEEDCPAGEKCMPWANDGGNSWNATRCTPVAEDPGAPGDPCTVEGSGVSGIDDCEKHAMCWGVDPETLMGTCLAMCIGTESNPICADPNSYCALSGEGVLILCFPTCDPLAQDCPEGEACISVTETFVCVPDVSGDAGEAGDPCEAVNACDPGLACVGAKVVPGCVTSGCCSPFCPVDVEPAACPFEDQVCWPWWEPGQEPPGYENIGVCALPE